MRDRDGVNRYDGRIRSTHHKGCRYDYVVWYLRSQSCCHYCRQCSKSYFSDTKQRLDVRRHDDPDSPCQPDITRFDTTRTQLSWYFSSRQVILLGPLAGQIYTCD